MFHFWFNTFFVRDQVPVPEPAENGNSEAADLIAERTRLSCDDPSHNSLQSAHKSR